MSAPSALRFAGYAALFGRRDAGRDVIRAGAFARTLADRAGPIPLLWQHRPDLRIGWIETAAEDARGLRVIAARITEGLPGDVSVTVEEERIVIRGRRIGVRMLRDPRFAVLRNGLGAGL